RNGEEGLAALSAAPLPDCVLLDLDMPVLNGQGMAHQMLVHDAGEEEVPILLVSGRNDLPAVAACMGTPYLVAKGNGNYGDLLLEMLERVLVERRAPASAWRMRPPRASASRDERQQAARFMLMSTGMVMPAETVAATSPLREGSSAEPLHLRSTVEGVLLHWVEFGAGTGRWLGRAPVVLLHGLNDSHGTWRQIASDLALDRRVLALDLPGHGLSDRPDAGYELAWYGRIVARWIEGLGLQPLEQVDIVGHSLGGGIALMLLDVCRPRIRRLVLAAPGGLGKEIFFLLRLASIPGLVERFGQPFMALGTRMALRRWG